MTIAFLHTAAVHVETFDALLAQSGYHGPRTHKVLPDLLAKARSHGLAHVRAEAHAALAELAAADAVVCTCSTLGPIADEVSRRHAHVFRIDRPAMELACTIGPDILVALCLDSTLAATLDLLADCADTAGRVVTPRVVLCAQAWPHFERGDYDSFANSIAAQIRSAVAGAAVPDAILLAQASMRVAEPRLAGLGIPVISSPLLAAQRAITIAGAR